MNLRKVCNGRPYSGNDTCRIRRIQKFYHDYASITDIHIDRKDGRIVVVYSIEITPDSWGAQFDAVRLRQLLEFCYHRLEKLDLERKYNRHYCSRCFFRSKRPKLHFILAVGITIYPSSSIKSC